MPQKRPGRMKATNQPAPYGRHAPGAEAGDVSSEGGEFCFYCFSNTHRVASRIHHEVPSELTDLSPQP